MSLHPRRTAFSELHQRLRPSHERRSHASRAHLDEARRSPVAGDEPLRILDHHLERPLRSHAPTEDVAVLDRQHLDLLGLEDGLAEREVVRVILVPADVRVLRTLVVDLLVFDALDNRLNGFLL